MTETETRQNILMAALRLLAEKGFAAVSMNDIVREAGTSKGGVYWHFKSKDEIIHAIFDYILEVQIALVNASLEGEGTATEKLRRIFQRASQEAEEVMPSPLEFYALAARDPVLMQRMTGYFESYKQGIATLIQQGMDEGDFTPRDPDLTAINIVSLMEGVMLVGLSIPQEQSLQAQINGAVDLILYGLHSPQEEEK